MSRFKNALRNKENAQEDDVEETSTRASSGSGRIGARGGFTEGSYQVRVVECLDGDCDGEIFNAIEPVYDIVWGSNHAAPIDMIWTDQDYSIEEGVVEGWEDNRFSSDRFVRVTCPECGVGNDWPLASEDGYMVLEVVDAPERNIPIPKNMVQYVEEPKDEWEVIDED